MDIMTETWFNGSIGVNGYADSEFDNVNDM